MTPRQHELLTFVSRYIAEHAISPSYEEISVALNLASKSGVVRLVNGLIDRGLLRREGGAGIARSLCLPAPLVGSLAAYTTEAMTDELHRRGFTVTADFQARP